ncbi:MAG: kinase/pyrophosphorylase [Alphaproteobacteria bacterium]|nr:kinase/pyrophosphorylase [Alphaproteobacteria bacterium]MDE2109637.1 kinase/pyrophosphorylase [Alphaproteobacteria bacterium]MDE2493057.1 kinase/pyrophosphorylase [Alphaproteobacteria bacterium]
MRSKAVSEQFHIHLISDATGETLHAVAKAALAQFEGVIVQEHSYTLVRSERQLLRAVDYIREHPGLVLFTVVNLELRNELVAQCTLISVPFFDLMEGPVSLMQRFFGAPKTHRPGGQHEVDQRYLQRIEALNFTIQHDDGQALDDLGGADTILVGASRTSKTPTCVYLAMRGVRAANVPLVLGMPAPPQLLTYTKPLVIGLWASPERLVQIRRNRLATIGEQLVTDYTDLEKVRAEVMTTRRLYEQQGWPSIDVTRRSVEETAATILNYMAERRGTPA